MIFFLSFRCRAIKLLITAVDYLDCGFGVLWAGDAKAVLEAGVRASNSNNITSSDMAVVSTHVDYTVAPATYLHCTPLLACTRIVVDSKIVGCNKKKRKITLEIIFKIIKFSQYIS